MIVCQSASGTSQMVASVSVSEGVEGVFFILPKIIGAKTNVFEIDFKPACTGEKVNQTKGGAHKSKSLIGNVRQTNSS